MKQLKDLQTPAFVINRHAFERNCQAALNHAKQHCLSIRPHVKTHKTVEGAFIQATGCSFDGSCQNNLPASSLVSGFVASTLSEVAMLVQAAEKYGGKPFNDILFGVPITKAKLGSVDVLRQRLSDEGQMHILVDHAQQIRHVEEYVTESAVGSAAAPKKFTAFLKLDTGYHRAGVPCDARGVKVAVAMIESPSLDLIGVYSHCGHAYDEQDPEKRDEIAQSDINQVLSFLELLQNEIDSKNDPSFSAKNLIVSIGSTPSLAHHCRNNQVETFEIHPGNYTLYDRQQQWTGACQSREDIAGRVIATVIGHYEDRNMIMLDAGALALTKDTTPQGGMCEITGFPELECHRMSQEVTLVRPRNPGTEFPFSKLPIGCMVSLLPNHSCLSAACFAEYYVINDSTCSFAPDETIEEIWTPAKYFSVS